MAEESRRETRGERDVSTAPAAKLKVVHACGAGSRVRGRAFESGNAAAKGRRRVTSPIMQLDKQAKKTVQWLMRVDPTKPLEPARGNSIVYALKFRAELFSAFQAAAEIAQLREEIAHLRAIVGERLSQ